MSRVLFFLFSLTLFGLAPIVTSAQTSCLVFPSNSSPASGYGASWDVLSSAKELLIKSNCPTSGNSINLTIGKGDSAQYIWNVAHVYAGSGWTAHTLSGPDAGSGWLTGQGTKTLTTPFLPTASNPLYFVGYVCTYHSSQWKCGCANASCTNKYWQLQAYKGNGGGTTGGSGSGSGTGGTTGGGEVVLHLPPRTVHMPPNRTGGAQQERIHVTPADAYYLDLTVTYRNQYDWDTREQSGKFPGLAGGAKEGGGNCTGEQPDSWSARNGFQTHGRMTTYLYFQNRDSGCGVKYQWKNPDGSDFYFQKARTYRVTQFVQVNTPGQPDGIDRVWVDGVMVYNKTDLVWRGPVCADLDRCIANANVARVDQFMYHAFFGGDTFDKTPSYDSYVDFGDIYVMSCSPDFARPPGNCR